MCCQNGRLKIKLTNRNITIMYSKLGVEKNSTTHL